MRIKNNSIGCINSLFRLAVLTLLPILFTLQLLSINGFQGWGDDWVGYLTQAQSIVSRTYPAYSEYNKFAIENTDGVLGPIAYPWGYPAVQSVVIHFFGESIILLQAINLFFFWITLLVLFYGLRSFNSRFHRLLLIALISASPVFIADGIPNLLSDVFFLLLSTISLLLICYLDFNVSSKDKFWIGIAFSVFASFACLTRTNGFLLLLVLLLSQYNSPVKTKKSSFLNFTHQCWPFALSIFFVFLGRFIFPAKESHYSYISSISIKSILSNAYHYFFSLDGLLGDSFAPVRGVVLIASLILFAYPLLVRKVDRFFAFYLYVFSTFFLYVIWPPYQGIRFLYPIIPFYLSIVFYGYTLMCSHHRIFSKPYFSMLGPILIGFSLVQAVSSDLDRFLNRAPSRVSEAINTPFSEQFLDLTYKLKQQLDSDAEVIFFKPRLLKYYSGLNSLRTTDLAKFTTGRYFLYYKKAPFFEQASIDSVLMNIELKTIKKTEDFQLYLIR